MKKAEQQESAPITLHWIKSNPFFIPGLMQLLIFLLCLAGPQVTNIFQTPQLVKTFFSMIHYLSQCECHRIPHGTFGRPTWHEENTSIKFSVNMQNVIRCKATSWHFVKWEQTLKFSLCAVDVIMLRVLFTARNWIM